MHPSCLPADDMPVHNQNTMQVLNRSSYNLNNKSEYIVVILYVT